ncbi:hypothetical protein EVAR_32745_1 [Eumeta japonica]|uniref:Uncharacterized protein n=1 Tax=Eumeta variegata TaxID=151549 RepID=A0A4C1XQR9_EUMVA|nr:hypothetical protein EVAR_32745_1 [Eumeta japonica]
MTILLRHVINQKHGTRRRAFALRSHRPRPTQREENDLEIYFIPMKLSLHAKRPPQRNEDREYSESSHGDKAPAPARARTPPRRTKPVSF